MKGAIAKEKVVEIISKAFGNDYIGEFNKKYYVWAEDGAEKVQICISLTCPKVNIDSPQVLNFDDEDSVSVTSAPVEITQEEKDTLSELMARLGL